MTENVYVSYNHAKRIEGNVLQCVSNAEDNARIRVGAKGKKGTCHYHVLAAGRGPLTSPAARADKIETAAKAVRPDWDEGPADIIGSWRTICMRICALGRE